MTIFDLDGTIIDISERWHHLHQSCARAFGFEPLERDAYVRLKRDGINEREIIGQRCSEEGFANYETCRQSKIEEPELLAYDRLFAGIEDVLVEWSKRGPIILATKRRDKNVCLGELESLGIRALFDAIAINPAAEKDQEVIKVVREAGMEIRDGWFISDSLADREAAKRLGLTPVTVGYGCRSPEYFRGKGILEVVENPSDLLQLANVL